MTILANDIKIRASKVMADVPEGGGGPGSNVIEWGQSNTMFDDVSLVARTLGNVSIRQAFLHVDTNNTDRLLGSHAFVARMPEDPNVAVTLAECGPFATRSQIQTAIANYLIRGVPWNGILLGDHVQGQASMQIMQRVGTRLPTIGRTLALVINEGAGNEAVEWVRVIKVESEERTFTDEKGDYQALVVQCDLASGMTRAVPGTDPNRYFQKGAGAALLRDTTTADASNYYGAAASVVPASISDMSIKVSGVYGQLVPSSSTQVPALNQRPAARRAITLAESPRLVEVPTTPHTRRTFIGQENRGSSYVFQLTPRPEPGTVVITWVGLGNRQTVEDNGSGELQGQGAGVVDYNTGSLAITLPSLPDAGSAIVVQWGERVAYTNRSSQGAQIRPPEYGFVLDGLGANKDQGQVKRETLVLTYTSNDTLKTITDDGTGQLEGDGTGFVDYYSRAVYVKPSLMPDAGVQFRCEYDVQTEVMESVANPSPDAGGFVHITLGDTPIAGSVRVDWAVARKVSDTSGVTRGTLQSNKDVSAEHSSIRVDTSTSLHRTGVAGQTLFHAEDNSWETQQITRLSGQASSASFTEQSAVDESDRIIALRTITDDGAGAFYDALGTVNYGGKELSLKMINYDRSAQSYQADYENAAEFMDAVGDDGSGTSSGNHTKGAEYGTSTVGEEMLAGQSVYVSYRTSAATETPTVMEFVPDLVAIELAPYTVDRVVPGSVRFRWMGTEYEDREGIIYRDYSSGPGIASGRIDYMSGIVLMTDYVVGGAGPGDLQLLSLWTQKGDWQTAQLFFMTDASPIQPGQITINCLDTAGNSIEVTADLNGNLTGPHAVGKIDYQNGLVQLMFGDLVADSSLSSDDKAEWWYNPADIGAVESGMIWRPWPVDPTSLRYNAVSNLFLPVDPEILGLNPTRLPQDGRVPIFAKGRIVCIGYQDKVEADTYATGTVQLPRQRLSHVWLIDNNGDLITEGFEATEEDLDAGELHITNVSGWAQPVTIEYRVQDMRLCTDVQIDGTLSFNFPLSHNFPPGSVVSSVLLFGDIFARVSNVFDQQSWNGTSWSDVVSGNPAGGTYNDAAYPITVTNAGALSERYALQFKANGTEFELKGEFSGGLGSGSKNSLFQPLNPFNHDVKLFSLPEEGWGSGWTSGNTLFIKLEAAMPSFACIRTVQPSQAAGTDYSFDLLAGGDIDRPPNDAP